MVLSKLGAEAIRGNRVDLGAMRSERTVKRGTEMLRLDRCEWRQREGASPVGEQGVSVFGCSRGLRAFHAAYIGGKSDAAIKKYEK